MDTRSNAIDAVTRLPADRLKFLLDAARELDSQTVLSQSIDDELTGADLDEITLGIAERNIELMLAKTGGSIGADFTASVEDELAHAVEMDIAMSAIHGGRVFDDCYCSNQKG